MTNPLETAARSLATDIAKFANSTDHWVLKGPFYVEFTSQMKIEEIPPPGTIRAAGIKYFVPNGHVEKDLLNGIVLYLVIGGPRTPVEYVRCVIDPHRKLVWVNNYERPSAEPIP